MRRNCRQTNFFRALLSGNNVRRDFHTLSELFHGSGQVKECGRPCQELVITPGLSYSALSDNKLKEVLAHRGINDIRRRFHHALEIDERVVQENRYFS